MARTSLLAAFLLVGIHLLRCISGHIVVLGDSFNFSATPQPQCSSAAELKLLHILLNGTKVPVASRYGTGSWKASPSYADRLQLPLVLTNTSYNDNGSYEFTCGGGEDTRIHVNVVVPIRFNVFENETVLLPCHAVTVGGEVKSVRWEKQPKSKVAKMSVASKKIILEDEFKSSVSVPTECFSAGDFSISLGPVQLHHQGDYICYVQDKPEVVARLSVQETRNETSTEQLGPGHQKEGMDQENGHTTCVTIVVTLALCAVAFGIAIGIGIGIGWWMRSCRSSSPPPPPPPRSQPEVAQEDVAVPLVSQNEPGLQPNGLALNGHR